MSSGTGGQMLIQTIFRLTSLIIKSTHKQKNSKDCKNRADCYDEEILALVITLWTAKVLSKTSTHKKLLVNFAQPLTGLKLQSAVGLMS